MSLFACAHDTVKHNISQSQIGHIRTHSHIKIIGAISRIASDAHGSSPIMFTMTFQEHFIKLRQAIYESVHSDVTGESRVQHLNQQSSL